MRQYNTKQRGAVLDYIRSLGDAHVTAAEIVSHFSRGEQPVGRTTVYRCLDRLTGDGMLRRYTTDGVSGACYQFTGGKDCCREHFHLKCERCGRLEHLECGALSELERHVLTRHEFLVNTQKTVFYGTCKKCVNNGGMV
ncbi:MAG: transcriptional repressor [Oscillospiraceae bacterium]|jgi:Fur family ferric uptake transcriptional regulator|nr:transcriptional repressor [Oscillospiraceae bacterium]